MKKIFKVLKNVDVLVGIQAVNWLILCTVIIFNPISLTDLIIFISVSIMIAGFLYLREALRAILVELRKK